MADLTILINSLTNSNINQISWEFTGGPYWVVQEEIVRCGFCYNCGCWNLLNIDILLFNTIYLILDTMLSDC